MSSEKSLLSHNDDPSALDNLDQSMLLREVCTQIKECAPPKGIGINGYWGTGKTSFLKQMQKTLVTDKQKTIQTIWFEAWRFQHEGLPIVALLNEIRAQMELSYRFKEKAKKTGGVALLGSIAAFDEVIKAASGGLFSPKLGSLAGIGEAWEKKHYQQTLPSQSIQNLLEEAIKLALGKNKKRLVIFIDDLDRCEPQMAFRLLEGIKVYLNLKNCVVVFGMDQRQIEMALSESLNFKDQAHRAREYLEKICQDVHYLPIPDQAKKEVFFTSLLKRLNHHNQDHVVAGLSSTLKSYDCLPANPRKIKILVNRVAMMLRNIDSSAFITQDDQQDDRAVLIFLAISIIYCFHPAIYEQLNKSVDYIQDVVNYAKGSVIISDKEKETHPMRGIIMSQDEQGRHLAVNPSDSNVFRLHEVMTALGEDGLLPNDIKPFIL